MIVQLSGKDHMCIIQVYAPTSDYDDEVIEAFYEDINKAFLENRGKYTIIMGDFNAKIGRREAGEEFIMGKFGTGERNKRGERLLEFAAEQKLKVTNTYFKKAKKPILDMGESKWNHKKPNRLYTLQPEWNSKKL